MFISWYPSDEEDNVEVHIFQLNQDFISNPTKTTFTYDSHKSEIELNPSSEEVTFTYTSLSTPSDETKRKFTVSKIVVYMWTDQGKSVPSIEVAIVESERKSIFENWTKSVNEDDNDS